MNTNHGESLVDVYDENGALLEVKKRSEVDKAKDIVKTIYVLAFDPGGRVYLSVIPRNGDFLWQGTWGTSCAGILRHGEDPYFGAARTMERELGIVEETQFIGEQLCDLNGVKRIVVLLTCVTDKTLRPNPLDAERTVLFEPMQVEEMIREKRCAPSLEACWKMYSAKEL